MNVEPVILEGTSIRLEPLGVQHAEGLWEAARDQEIWRWIPFKVTSEADARGLIAFAEASAAQGTAFAFAQVDAGGGTVVGSTSYLAVDSYNKRLEIGATWIAPRFQRTRVNTEAKFLLLRHAFEVLGCNRVEFKTDSCNSKSRAALARIGAREEGTFRCHMVRPDGTLRDSVYFSIIAGEWPEVKQHLEGLLSR